MRVLPLLLGALLALPASAATVVYTEASGENLAYCRLTIVDANGAVLQGLRVPTLTSSGGQQRTVEIAPTARSKSEGMALNLTCCNRLGQCTGSDQETHDFNAMMPEDPAAVTFDGTTLAYTEPARYQDGSAITNLRFCSFEFISAAGALLQALPPRIASQEGGTSRSFAPVVNASTQSNAAFLDVSCTTRLGIRGVPRRISVQGVFE